MRGRKPSQLSRDDGLRKLPGPPSWLSVEAKAEWKRVSKILAKRQILTAGDLASLETYCLAVGQVRQCQAELAAGPMWVESERSAPRPHPAFRVMHEAMRQARQYASELGLTPVSRARSALAPQGDDDEFAGMDI